MINLNNQKIKENQKEIKWNISILVIFVLLISGLIWVLTMNFIKQMLWYTNDIYSYHKSYYYANAWLELALVEIDNAGIWFSNNVWSGDGIFVDNFECINCDFSLNVEGKTQYLSDKFWLNDECGEDNSFALQSGWSLVLPLFTQEEISSNADLFVDEINYNMELLKYTDEFKFINTAEFSSQRFNVWLFILSGGDIQKDLLFIESLNGSEDMISKYFDDYRVYYTQDVFNELINNENYLMYLVISNINEGLASFCIHMYEISSPTGSRVIYLPTANFFVNSLGSIWDKSVWLQAIYRQPVPSFLVNSFN